ncbi:MAG: glycosyltransferase family 2 protein [Acidobacteriaceae bacterium]|nr:glycosyltransferase family 2 protein [Acidobacteriaceae bacterium]
MEINSPTNAGVLSVVVPAYNEQSTIALVIQKLLLVPNLLEIIVVDDCSTDNTYSIAQQLERQHNQIVVLRHEKNAGKTAALKTGFRATKGSIVIVQDADLEYDPAEISSVIQPIIDGYADVVYGSRFLVRKQTRVLYLGHFLANKALTFCSNLFTNVNLTDTETCYKAFRGEIIRNMIITSKGFGFEIEVTAKICKYRYALYEVPISYYGRTYKEGKKIGLIDGLHAFWYIIYYNLFTSS